MENNNIKEKENHKSVSISIVSALLWEKRIFVVKFCVIILALAIVYIYSIPRKYKSTVIMLPETVSENSISGSLGALASMAGIKLGAPSKDAIVPEFYPKVLNSTPFLLELLKTKVTLSNGKVVSLYDYLDKYQKTPWWNFLSQKDETDGDTKSSLYISKEQQRIIKKMQSSLVCMVDKKTDLVTLEVSMQDPQIAAYVVNAVKDNLQNYITEYRTEKLRNDVEYIDQIVKETLQEYNQNMQNYVNFADTHQDIFLAKYEQEEKRLANKMNLSYNIYSQAVQQQQLAKSKLQEHTPVFVTLQPGYIPLKPSEPKRIIFLFLVGCLSLLLSFCWVIVRNLYWSSSFQKK